MTPTTPMTPTPPATPEPTSSQAPAPSIPSLIRGLFHPGPMPQRTKRTALIAIPTAATLCLALLIIGWLHAGDTGEQFGEGRPGTLMSVGILLLSAWVATKVSLLATPAAFRFFWFVLGSLLFLAAADDMFKLHEKLDEQINAMMEHDPQDPLFDRLDDLIVLAYVSLGCGLPGLIFLRRLLALRWTAWFFGCGALFFLAMVLIDTLSLSDGIEETFKVLAGVCIFTGIAAAEHQFTAQRTQPDLAAESLLPQP